MNETVAPVGFHRGRIDRPKSKVIVSPGGVDAEIIVFASVPAGERDINEAGIGVAVETEAARRIGLDDIQPVGDGNAREQFFPLVITAVGVRIDVDTSAVGCGLQADAAKQQQSGKGYFHYRANLGLFRVAEHLYVPYWRNSSP